MSATPLRAALDREPAWESFLRGRLLREEDVARLTKIADVARALDVDGDGAGVDRDERRSREARGTMRATMRHHGAAVCETLLGALGNVGATEATEHVLALVDVVVHSRTWDVEGERSGGGEVNGAALLARYDGRHEDAEASGTLAAVDGTADADAFYAMSRTLSRPDSANSRFIKETSARVLAKLIEARPRTGVEAESKAESARRAARVVVSWASKELQSWTESGDDGVVPAVACALAGSLEIPESRVFAATEGIVGLLTPVLRANDRFSVQTMYEVALCFWLMSFTKEGRKDMCARGASAVKALMACAGAASKEKVIRMCVLALKNVTDRQGAQGEAVLDNFTAVDEPLQKLVRNLSLKGFEDEELSVTLTELDEDLLHRRKEASSWERYRDEVMSGSLEWSAAHRDEGFWRECATKLTDNNCQILRVLIKLIDGNEPMDSKTLAVACNDIGEFAVHYPAGRFLANDLGGKEHTMRLMNHEDDEVRKYALQCVQKLLVSSWRSLGKTAEAKQ